ncbi:MAG TPA: hypothetical protein VGE29_17240 [Prosthecobacter sp.]
MTFNANPSLIFFAVLIAVALLKVSAARAEDISLASCPVPVQETIQKNLHGGVLDEVKFISVAGRILYVAEVDLPGGRDLKVHVGRDGGLIKTREEITLAEVPAAVVTAAQKLVPEGGKIDDVDRETANGTVTYRIEIDRPLTRELKLHFAADGTVLNQREDS